MTEAFVPEKKQAWPGFGYVQVPGLANRHISRWLRYQRRNMLRFFVANKLTTLADRLQRIRKSNKSMLEKNRMFQGVLDEYSRLVNPAGAPPVASAEAGDPQVPGSAPVDVRDGAVAVGAEGVGAEDSGPGSDAGSGVHGLADPSDAGAVIEE